jgi:hypothetical protein
MGATRFPRARLLALACSTAILLAAPGPGREARADDLKDAPVIWYEDDRLDILSPDERDPNLLWDMIETTAVRPVARHANPIRFGRDVGTLFGGDPAPAARNVNRLGEVPNSSWFTNRIGLFLLSPGEAASGPLGGEGPDRGDAWVVVSAKTEGVTPGFNIRDAKGGRYLVKFDPPGYPNMTTAAGVIAGRILHAAGYFVPQDDVVTFRREDLVLGENVMMTDRDGTRRPMREADIDAILERVVRREDGSYRALASNFVPGKPLGPFDYQGRRHDDPNDRIDHEDRRELRGLRVFAAWINHFDTKQDNTLDVYVEEDGNRFVRHYLIDFASTLGSGATGPVPRYGYEFTLDAPPILGRFLALGIHQDAWRRLRRPEGLEEIGYIQSRPFDPFEFKPLQPNSAFSNLTDRDGYWAAKIVTAFTVEHLEAIVREGRYDDPEATRFMVRMLAERRDTVGRTWFDRIPPLDFFQHRNGRVTYRDLGAERGLYPGTDPRYRVRCSALTAGREAAGWSAWVESGGTEVEIGSGPLADHLAAADAPAFPFVALECCVDRGSGWSRPVTAYMARGSGRVVAVER